MELIVALIIFVLLFYIYAHNFNLYQIDPTVQRGKEGK